MKVRWDDETRGVAAEKALAFVQVFIRENPSSNGLEEIEAIYILEGAQAAYEKCFATPPFGPAVVRSYANMLTAVSKYIAQMQNELERSHSNRDYTSTFRMSARIAGATAVRQYLQVSATLGVV